MAPDQIDGRTLNLQYLILRYIVVMVLTGLFLAVVDFALHYFWQFQGGAGVGIVAAIVPAMDAGHVYARRMRRVPAKGEAWRLSAILLAVNMVFSGIIVLALAIGTGIAGQLGDVMNAIMTPLGLGLLGFFLVIYLLATRFFLGSGAKNEIKRQMRIARKQE
ncbi:ABZJ_00895 family protein [Sulfitobacter sp. MF3-043]|uniref:ABZJ_00895 family protein n=1 Tax=Sulfitobacter sediminivivens TaxID=3252902 RepID=UPI0036D918B1